MKGVPRISILPQPRSPYLDQYGTRVTTSWYQLVEAPKHGALVEESLGPAREEQPLPVVHEESSDAQLIEAGPYQRQRIRSIMAKVCKCVMWLQVVTATLSCLIWGVAQLI